MPDNAPHNALRRHVTGAVESGTSEPVVGFTGNKEDDVYDIPCPECGAGPLDLKGYGAVCPNGHIMEGE